MLDEVLEMAKYKFDGTELKDGGKTVANVRGDDIREGSGSHVIGNIRGDDIRQGSGSSVMFNIRGDEIRQGSGSSKIGTMENVHSAIDGPGKVVKAALWVLCCR
jgi:hypothetical protein